MAIRTEITADLSTLLASVTPKQMGASWRGALMTSARKLRKIAIGYFKAAKLHNRGKMVKAFRASVRRDLKGFSVKISTGKNHPQSLYTNRRGQAKPIVLWANIGTHNRWRKTSKGRASTGSTTAHRFMDAARNHLPAIKREIEVEVRKRAEKAVAKNIKKHYGIK